MSKRNLKWMSIGLMIALALSMLLVGCDARTPKETESQEKRIFTDSIGREIELPEKLSRIAPSGTLANIILFTAAPDHLCGISQNFSKTQLKLIDEKYDALPVMGKFYGKGPDFNLETVLAADTEVIADFGEAKKSTAEDMDSMMEQIKVPTVFIEATFAAMPETYRDIGRLIGDHERTDLLAAYCEATLQLSDQAKEALSDDEQISVYWAMGELGLNTNARGSFHSELLDFVPLINVADVDAADRGGGSEVSMEQIIQWDPDYILIDTLQLKEEMLKDPAWAALPAIQEGRYIVIPQVPYGFLADPPSVNRYVGLRWLGASFYPDIYTGDKVAEVKEFFELFYGIKTDDATIDEILAGRFE